MLNVLTTNTCSIFKNFWKYTFYEFQGQSKGHKVNYLKTTWS